MVSFPKRPVEKVESMPYTAEINRDNPTCFLFLVDQSGSMNQSFGDGSGLKKCQGVADTINRLLYELVQRCSKGEPEPRDWYYIGVIGYGKSVGPALGGSLAGQGLIKVSEIAKNPLRIDRRLKKQPDGAGGVIELRVKFPVWFEAVADGKTPMCEALKLAREAVAGFVGEYPRSRPPVVINITDGQPSDGDPEPAAAALREICSEDGNVLLFNIHVSALSTRPIEFPDSEAELPDEDARRLFRMSSEIPPAMLDQARTAEVDLKEGCRGFVFNGDLVTAIQGIEMGTRAGPNRI
jgi:hypothetical protein